MNSTLIFDEYSDSMLTVESVDALFMAVFIAFQELSLIFK